MACHPSFVQLLKRIHSQLHCVQERGGTHSRRRCAEGKERPGHLDRQPYRFYKLLSIGRDMRERVILSGACREFFYHESGITGVAMAQLSVLEASLVFLIPGSVQT